MALTCLRLLAVVIAGASRLDSSDVFVREVATRGPASANENPGKRRRLSQPDPEEEEEESEDSEPCSTSQRARSAWCERAGEVDVITFEPIGDGKGLCLDGKCYDQESLVRWLEIKAYLPHNRAPFSVRQLQAIAHGYVLANVQDTAEKRLQGHEGLVTAVAFSADGRLVATGSADTTARIWDVASLQEIRRFAHARAVTSLAISGDGRRLATGTQSHDEAKLWSVETSQDLGTLTHWFFVGAVAINHDGSRVLTASHSTVTLWDAMRCTELDSFKHPHPVCYVGFAPNGIATVDYKSFRRWHHDGHDGFGYMVNELQYFEDSLAQVHAAAVSSDGQRALVAGPGNVTLREISTGRELFRAANLPVISSVAFGANESVVLTGHLFGEANLFDVGTGIPLRHWNYRAAQVVSVAYSPNNGYMGAGVLDDVVLF